MALTRQGTGYTDLTAASDFSQLHTWINNVEHNFEDAFALLADTAADLPASGNWYGRRIWVLSSNCPATWVGSKWDIADTGWLNMTAPTGYTTTAARARVKNGVLWVSAGASKTSGGGWSVGNAPLVFPAVIASQIVRNVQLTAVDGANASLLATASTAGSIQIGSASTSAAVTIWGGGPVD